MIAETLAFGTGTVGGAAIKLVGKLLDNYADATKTERQYELEKAKAHQTAAESARAFATGFSGGLWARRFIVLTVFAYLFVYPFVLALLNLPIYHLTIGDGAGIFGWMFGLGEGIQVEKMDGFTVFPFQTVLASMVAGFYFGAGVLK